MPKAVRMRSDMSAFAAAIEKSNGQAVTRLSLSRHGRDKVFLVTSWPLLFFTPFS